MFKQKFCFRENRREESLFLLLRSALKRINIYIKDLRIDFVLSFIFLKEIVGINTLTGK